MVATPAKFSRHHCEDYDAAADKCKENSCADGYVLNKATGQCTKKCVPENCLESDGSRICTKCLPGFYIVDDHCIKNPSWVTENCDTFDPTTYECLSCLEGYRLETDTKECSEIIVPNCKTTGLTACKECNWPYT